jgi:mannose-6-phosphate isomerase-like protein (cupin superfamily)
VDPKLIRVGEKGQSLSDPSGLRMTLVETPDSSGGHLLEMEWSVPPGERLVAADHYHPDGPEVWRIESGTAGYRLAGEEHSGFAPHEYTVPAGTSHGHPWNDGEDTLVARQIIASPDEPIPELTGGVQGFFETVFAFAQRDRVNERGEIDDRLQWILTIHDLLMPGSFLAGIPRPVQRGLFGAMAATARATGKRAYHEPQFDA